MFHRETKDRFKTGLGSSLSTRVNIFAAFNIIFKLEYSAKVMLEKDIIVIQINEMVVVVLSKDLIVQIS